MKITYFNIKKNSKTILTKNFLLSLLFNLGIVFFPLYIFPSGKPQLSHIILFLFILLFFLLRRFPLRYNTLNILLLGLVVIILIRQSIYTMETEKIEMLFPVLYIIFNSILFITTINYLSINPFLNLKLLRYSIIVSIIIAVIGVFVTGFSLTIYDNTIYRATGTFNNPNQLAYFSICILGIASSLYISNNLSSKIFLLVFSSSLFLSILSLSKAAMIGILFYLIIFLNPKRIKYIILFLFITTSLGIYIQSQNISYDELKFVQRLSTIGSDQDDSLSERGYKILFNPDLRIIYGWGEGYASQSIGHEIHSTIGNILISYGLMGFIIFIAMVIIIFKNLISSFGIFTAVGLMLPVFFYGIAHNGFRFSIFWIFLAILYFLSKKIYLCEKNVELYRYYEKD